MAKKYIVQRFPMNHPKAGVVPVGEEVDLSHLSESEIQLKLDRRQVALKPPRAAKRSEE
jgi:hypothetical protein